MSDNVAGLKRWGTRNRGSLKILARPRGIPKGIYAQNAVINHARTTRLFSEFPEMPTPTQLFLRFTSPSSPMPLPFPEEPASFSVTVSSLESETFDEEAELLPPSLKPRDSSDVVPVKLNALRRPLGRSLKLGATGLRLPLARPPITGISYVVARQMYSRISYRMIKAQGPIVNVPRMIYQTLNNGSRRGPGITAQFGCRDKCHEQGKK
ncbi:predicted protein [Uncinocarpus reesii 1704]|uniref:Uncharacterized protein n=1 Tax=Uncinocarpus reesii (strain UAMH 1704) TaxID=336963 RepID=C4JZ18_UNCRE|nr:uncharacterized protein UREG_07419 [Uncinocarpus reesii 1704]EEP82554.1 predicted protein [Uncinocarpus reesii 1704]